MPTPEYEREARRLREEGRLERKARRGKLEELRDIGFQLEQPTMRGNMRSARLRPLMPDDPLRSALEDRRAGILAPEVMGRRQELALATEPERIKAAGVVGAAETTGRYALDTEREKTTTERLLQERLARDAAAERQNKLDIAGLETRSKEGIEASKAQAERDKAFGEATARMQVLQREMRDVEDELNVAMADWHDVKGYGSTSKEYQTVRDRVNKLDKRLVEAEIQYKTAEQIVNRYNATAPQPSQPVAFPGGPQASADQAAAQPTWAYQPAMPQGPQASAGAAASQPTATYPQAPVPGQATARAQPIPQAAPQAGGAAPVPSQATAQAPAGGGGRGTATPPPGGARIAPIPGGEPPPAGPSIAAWRNPQTGQEVELIQVGGGYAWVDKRTRQIIG